MKYTKGGVTAAKGFKAAGIHAGIKENSPIEKFDVGLLVSDSPCVTACVYTQNKVKGAPIEITKLHLEKSGGMSRGVIVNSGNANTCNADGKEKAEEMCSIAAAALGINPDEMIVASTGVIGQKISIEPVKRVINTLKENLSFEGGNNFTKAIMTTDTTEKEYAVTFEAGGKTCTIGGTSKGSGMIAPNMATNLNFLTSDTAISKEMLKKALSETVKITYNCLVIDGDTSTNDMAAVMCNGLAGNTLIETENEDYNQFKEALTEVMRRLTIMLAKDGEGATKLLTVNVSGSPDIDTAVEIAKTVVGSSLLKCAVFGSDANWGRVLCAMGYSKAEFDPNTVDVDFRSKKGIITLCKNGTGVNFSEEKATEILSETEIDIDITLNNGNAKASAYGCDLTYDYVKINGDYRS